jgi:hypothetical protein
MEIHSADEKPIAYLSWLAVGCLIAVGTAGFFVAVVLIFRPSPAINFTVVNHGPHTLRNVTLLVAGSPHLLGDLAPEREVRLKVLVDGKGHVTIESTADDGKRVSQPIDCYLMARDSGEFNVEMRDGRIEGVRQETKMNPY